MATNRHAGPNEGGLRTASEEGQSGSTDGSGDHTHTFADVRGVDKKSDVQVQVEAGRVANVTSVSKRSVTFRVFESAGSAAAMAAATSQSITYNIEYTGY